MGRDRIPSGGAGAREERMRRTRWIFSILLAIGLLGWMQAAMAQQPRAYDYGYQAGYTQGKADGQAGLKYDYAGSETYQNAGTDFREGFRAGYGAGWREINGSSPQNSQAPPGDEAFRNGYRSGYNQGRNDAGARYRPTDSDIYQYAMQGYDAARFPSVEDYKFSFQQGFKAGYDDAYHGRAFDSRRGIPRVNNQGTQMGVNPGPADVAFNNGYRAGHNEGRTDVNREYQPHASRIYREAMQGYRSGSDISSAEYRDNFRRGYNAGYDDGYNGRTARISAGAPRGFGYGQSGGPLAYGPIAVPAGTTLRLRLNENLSTKTSQPNDPFTASLQEPVYTPDGRAIAIPAGATVRGRVTDVMRAGRVSGNAEMHLSYDSITLPNGTEYRLNATTEQVDTNDASKVQQDEGTVQGNRSTGREVGTVAAGAVIGAIIGSIAGGGKGAGIGAAVGSAAGIGTVLATRGSGDLELPSGTPMEIRLNRTLELRR